MNPPLPSWHLEPANGILAVAGRTILRLTAGWTTVPDITGAGIFLRPPGADPAAYLEHPLGCVDQMVRFTSLYRFSPFWTRPAVGQCEGDVHPETVWLLARTESGQFTMVVPLLDARTRFSLRADAGALVVVAETGDPALTCTDGTALFVAAGDDPYALVTAGARALSVLIGAQLGAGRLRADKPLPDFVDQFGWCTWDAFYKDVTPDKVLRGLEGFRQAGIQPRLLILDDGWQTWARGEGGEDRLVSLAPNERFGGDLTPLVQAAKSQYGIQNFFVWHALLGYWGGLSAEAFPHYGIRSVPRSFGPGLLAQEPRWNVHPWGAQQGVPAADQFGAFYNDWHASLARQGVDGVKVDAQAMLEAVSAGQGGRVALACVSRRALEASTDSHFDGCLINCMSCTPECVYLSAQSTVLRTSDDFFPQQPESHGLHLFVNAMASLWFGEFMQPDWDMFHSVHAHAGFHAAARAVSGGPVYVSDGIGKHDAALLNKLVLSDGRVLRADLPARPAPDTLMADPTREPVLLKVFNRNGDCGVVGLFHAGQGPAPIEGSVSLADVPVLPKAQPHAAWAHQRDRLWLCEAGGVMPLVLGVAEWEIVSFAPVERGFAALGLADKFNSTGAVVSRTWHDAACDVVLRDGGRFLAWAAHAPEALWCDGAPIPFTHDPVSGRLEAELVRGGRRCLRLRWR